MTNISIRQLKDVAQEIADRLYADTIIIQAIFPDGMIETDNHE